MGVNLDFSAKYFSPIPPKLGWMGCTIWQKNPKQFPRLFVFPELHNTIH